MSLTLGAHLFTKLLIGSKFVCREVNKLWFVKKRKNSKEKN